MGELKPCLVELTSASETDLTGSGTWDPIAGTFALDSKSHDDWELGSGCLVTYNGDDAVLVDATISGSITPAVAAKDLSVGFFVDGTQEQKRVTLTTVGTGKHPVSFSTLLDVASGETVEARLLNETDDTNATASQLTMKLMGVSYSS